jgi:DNA-binding response OmpR family regulator
MAHILIIDDDEILTDLLKDHLTQAGHEVTTAGLSEEGLRKAIEHQPDLIMLDLMLPDGTGYQTCGKLRQIWKTRSVPIIMMSSSARLASQHSIGRMMGVNAYMMKPLNLIETGDCVNALLNSTLPAERLPAPQNEQEVA